MSDNPFVLKEEEDETKKETEGHDERREQNVRTDHVKEEDWEVVDKSKETNSALTSLDFVNVQEESDSVKPTENEAEDWYQTLPRTPANTPEFTPSQPSYPSGVRKADAQKTPENADLPTIKEEVTGEGIQEANETTENLNKNDNESQDLETPNSLRNTLVIAGFTITRFVIYVLLFGTLGWTLAKMWRKIQDRRGKTQVK